MYKRKGFILKGFVMIKRLKDPQNLEITAQCAEIRSGWSSEELKERSVPRFLRIWLPELQEWVVMTKENAWLLDNPGADPLSN